MRWAWEADEAKQLADKAVAKAQREPAGPRHETLMKQAETVRWMLEEFYVSLWAQELGTPKPISLQRIKKAIASATSQNLIGLFRFFKPVNAS